MAFDLAEYVLKGYRFTQDGSVVNVVSPEGRHGSGSSPDDAVLNIGATIIPVERAEYIGRVLTREDGSEVMLDVSGIIEAEGETAPPEVAAPAAPALVADVVTQPVAE